MEIHPQDEVLERLARAAGETDPRLLRHLSGCPRCRARLAGLRLREGEPAPVVRLRPGSDLAYDDAFERSLRIAQGWDAALRRERSEAPALLAELAAHSPEQCEILLRNGHRFHRWGHQRTFDIAAMRALLQRRFSPEIVEERFFNDWHSTTWSRRVAGLIKKLLSKCEIGTYGTARSIFFVALKSA